MKKSHIFFFVFAYIEINQETTITIYRKFPQHVYVRIPNHLNIVLQENVTLF